MNSSRSHIETPERDRGSELTDVYAKLDEICDKKIYCGHNISESKKEYARWSYAADINPTEEIIVLFDNTFWGTAQYGCFVTKTRFYSNDRRFGIKRSEISASTHFSIEKNKLMINGIPFLIFSRRQRENFTILVNVLNMLTKCHSMNKG